MSTLACVLQLDGQQVKYDLMTSVARRLDTADRPARSAALRSVILSTWPGVLLPGETPDDQPYQENGVTAILDGRIDNREDLKPLLVADHHADMDSVTDVQLVLRAYQKWGLDCAAYLIGDYAFVIWDATTNRLVAGRDPMGLRTLFYRQVGHTLLLASELRGLLLPELPPVSISAEYLCTYLRELGVADTPATPWNGVYRLPKGCCLVAERGLIRVTRFWDLRNAPTVRFRNPSEYAEAFRELFTQAVCCRMRSPSPIAVSMSGGLDSTSVYVTAKRLASSKSMVFPVSAIYDEFIDSDERQYIQSVLNRYEEAPCIVSGDGSWTFRDFDKVPVMDEPWVNLASYHLQLTLQQAAKDRGAQVILTGYGGDQVLSGSLERMAGYLKRLRLIRLVRHMTTVARMYRLPYSMIWRQYVWDPSRGKYSESENDWSWLTEPWRKAVTGFSPVQDVDPDPARELRYSIINKALAVLAFGPAISQPLGVELRHPFLDRRVVEFLYGAPDEIRLDETLTQKRILRDAMQTILPPKILARAGKTMSHSAIFQGIQREWSRVGSPIMQHSHLVEMHVADRDELINALNRFRMGAETAETVWLAITLEAWLRRPDTRSVAAANSVRTHG